MRLNNGLIPDDVSCESSVPLILSAPTVVCPDLGVDLCGVRERERERERDRDLDFDREAARDCRRDEPCCTALTRGLRVSPRGKGQTVGRFAYEIFCRCGPDTF